MASTHREMESDKSSSAWRYIHTLTLCSFAFAQPIFDLLSQCPQFFVASQTSPLEIALFVICLMLAIPALIVAIEVVPARLVALVLQNRVGFVRRGEPHLEELGLPFRISM